MSSKLYPGLLPFLKSSSRIAMRRIVCRYAPRFRLLLRGVGRNFGQFRTVLKDHGRRVQRCVLCENQPAVRRRVELPCFAAAEKGRGDGPLPA
jgi:hypothetical protein